MRSRRVVGFWVFSGVLLVACFPGSGFADELALRLLAGEGAVSYAQKDSYGRGIQMMLLGYDAEGSPLAGVALRETPTYTRALTYLTVVRKDEGYLIRSVQMPELGSFHGASQDYAREALEDITGRAVSGATEARGLVDAVTGATQYRQAIYVSSSLMATRIIDELEKNPDWERHPMP